MLTNPSSTVQANWRYVLPICLTGLLLFLGTVFTGHSEQRLVNAPAAQTAYRTWPGQPPADCPFPKSDALEARYPMLRGTIRDQVTQQRRPFVRFFACEQDLSHELPDTPLPDAVATGAEPLLVVGAIAGG
jgi:hypothetical protein